MSSSLWNTLRPLSAALAVAVTGALIGACAPGQDEEAYGGTDNQAWDGSMQTEEGAMQADTGAGLMDQIQVTVTEYEIQLEDTITAGEAEFRVTNQGTMAHSVKIEGLEVDESVDDLEPGQAETLNLDLEPGTYRVYSPEFEERGMTVTVVAVDGAAAGGAGTPEPATPGGS